MSDCSEKSSVRFTHHELMGTAGTEARPAELSYFTGEPKDHEQLLGNEGSNPALVRLLPPEKLFHLPGVFRAIHLPGVPVRLHDVNGEAVLQGPELLQLFGSFPAPGGQVHELLEELHPVGIDADVPVIRRVAAVPPEGQQAAGEIEGASGPVEDHLDGVGVGRGRGVAH